MRYLSLGLLTLAGCTYDPPAETRETAVEDTAQQSRPVGEWTTDPATGEVRASITTEEGTTTLEAGSQVVARLPRDFTLYPGARIVNTINIGRGEGRGILLSIESDDPVERLVAYYRREAEEADVAIELDMSSEAMTMIGGKGGRIDNFVFQASRESGRTTGQLTIESGLN